MILKKHPSKNINICARREWVGKAMAVFLMWIVSKMIWARRHDVGKKTKFVVCTASDQTTRESIVSAQHGLNTVYSLMQKANISILKIWSILLSNAPKVSFSTYYNQSLYSHEVIFNLNPSIFYLSGFQVNLCFDARIILIAAHGYGDYCNDGRCGCFSRHSSQIYNNGSSDIGVYDDFQVGEAC